MPNRLQQSPIRPLTTEWAGFDVFIIGGGTSVDYEAVNSLRGRPASAVMVINSSYLAFPWADSVLFADERWLNREMAERPAHLAEFGKAHEALAIFHRPEFPWIRPLARKTDRGLSKDPHTVHLQTTSTTGAINVAFHRGARRIILVGIDNRDGEVNDYGKFRVHHHEEYPWRRKPETWTVKHAELKSTVPDLAARGIEVINASLISTLDFWRRVDLAAWLKEQDDENHREAVGRVPRVGEQPTG